jgi:hypothetical protein
MPNCDFYAAEQDLEAILKFVFDELNRRVYESYSEPDKELIEFKDSGHLLSYRNAEVSENLFLLQLWPVEASKNVWIKKFSLNPEYCDGATFRYNVEGWGLIQLYFGGVKANQLHHSHTNHNSRQRAMNWSETLADSLGDPLDWDWKIVSSVSGKLNRYIRKQAASKVGSRPVLPYAHRLEKQGVRLV